MKTILLLIMAITTNIFTAGADEQGHTLVKLWRNYEKAVSDDRPKDQLAILEDIKEEAAEQHLIWDFCDAARKYADVRSSMNWKLRDSLETSLDKELEAFGEPAAFIFAGSSCRNADSLDAYIRENAEKLAGSSNSILYSEDSRLAAGGFGKILPELVANDLEYALWCLHSNWGLKDESKQLIAEGLDRYPMNALFEFHRLLDGKPDEEELRNFAARYSGKAAALLAEQELLRLRFNRLNEGKAGGDDYQKLLADSEALSDKAEKFSGDEGLIAGICIRWCGDLDGTLHSKDIFADSDENVLTIALRNLGSVRVSIFKDKEKIFERSLDNPARSFYALDTLRMELPALADGEYRVKLVSGKTETGITHEKYSISLALKDDSEGPAVYAADYMSGKPLGWCSLTLRDEDGRTVAELPRLDIDGFSRLPESFTEEFPDRKWGWTLQASLKLPGRSVRLSRKLRISSYGYHTADEAVAKAEPADDRLHCMLLTDRSAFNPGETVNFKTVLYRGDYSHRLAGEGIRLTARLLDPEDKELSAAELTTGEFSSAAGSFVLKKSRLGGYYTILIEHEGRILASERVLADEFVLPSFNLAWAEDDMLHLPGDRIEIRGNIKAYSGHSLGAADISYTVSDGGDTISSGPLTTDSDGNFTIAFDSHAERGYAHYAVSVKVSDATGETREFDTSLYIRSDIPLEMKALNAAEGSFELEGDDSRTYLRTSRHIFTGDIASFELGTEDGCRRPDAVVEYSLSSAGKVLKEGSMAPGKVDFMLEGGATGLYKLNVNIKAKAHDGKEFSSRDSVLIFHVPSGSKALNAPGVRSFFLESADEELSLRMGATCGPVWAVAELYGDGNRPLDRKMIYLGGISGREGSLETVSFERKSGYPPLLTIKIFYFRDKRSFSYTREFDFRDEAAGLPLEFTRFLDTTSPSKSYSFIIRTEPGVECAATVFDASTETFMPNVWSNVRPWNEPDEDVYYSSICGVNGSGGMNPRPRGMTKGMARINSAMASPEAVLFDLAMDSGPVLEESAVVGFGTSGSAPAPDMHIREDFESTIAWEPFLRSDDNGEIRFDFSTSDKLSLYYVQLFAHDRNFRNSTLRREMTVTLPVKVAVVQPQYLYESDRWNARVSVSNMLDTAVSGKIGISFLDGADVKTATVLTSGSDSLAVEAGGSAEFSLSLDAPATGTLGLLASFIPDDADYGSDAVFVTVPVMKPVQTITEAHSALYRPGEDKDALIAGLRGMFENANGGTASMREISIREMLGEAIPRELYPEDEDVLSLSAALWADNLLGSLDGVQIQKLSDEQKAGLAGKIAACANSNGGFGWFAGMNSSPIITAVLLERFSGMGDACPEEIARLLPAAVNYIDREMFGRQIRPLWCGGLSLAQYLHVRSLYPSVALNTGNLTRKELKEFRKAVREYLVPSDEAGLNGLIFAKARRLSTLQALLSDDAGIRLAKKLGITAMTGRRLSGSLARDIESLSQYAEKHASGGFYYPNAVMPWRGLLESELYAHSMLCKLMESCGRTEIAEGIRLWIMVQKETQRWEADPGYIEALATVMCGSEETLDTRVIVLTATRELPFEAVREAGNGFTVEREFYLNGKRLADGDTLHVGDRLTAIYKIWNEENRSFVRLSVPRNAALRPVDQTSGHYGWMMRPLSVPGWGAFTPQGYRSVRADRTEYWFESYPEEKTSVTEEFFVTQEGRFQSPVVEIESLYAPHYRANGAGTGAMTVIKD